MIGSPGWICTILYLGKRFILILIVIVKKYQLDFSTFSTHNIIQFERRE